MKRLKPSYAELQLENERLKTLLSFKNAGIASCHEIPSTCSDKVYPGSEPSLVPENENTLLTSGRIMESWNGKEAQRDRSPWSIELNQPTAVSQNKAGVPVPGERPDLPAHRSISFPDCRILLNETLKIPGILSGTAIEKMKEKDEMNTSLLNVLPLGINIIDEEGTILFQSEYLTKKSDTGFVNQKCWTVLCDNKTQCACCPLKEGIQVDKTTHYEAPGMAGGKTFHISQTGIIYQGKKANLEIFRDVTEKKEIKKKVRLLAHALESIKECVSITDQNDQIIFINESFRTTYGYSNSELIGQNIQMVRPVEMENLKVRDILSKTPDGGWRGEIMNKKKDGTLFPVLLSSSAIQDEQGNLMALINVAMDITGMRKTREELMEAKELAEESNRLKTALLNNLSHEIRTPMNAIMGFSNLLPEATTEEKAVYAEIIKKSSGHLLNMLDDVILISRLQSEKMPLNRSCCRPAEIIGDVYRMFQHSDLNHGLAIRMNVPEASNNLEIWADEDKIVQILTNLVSNAVKYTLKGSIDLGFTVGQGQVEFYVEDTGIGIPQKELDKIFDNFYRGEQALTYAVRGHGLGLCITRELIELMGGTISVQSEQNRGSRFYFTLPCTAAPS